MREIGSEFWEVPLCDRMGTVEFPEDARYFLSGRSALSHIIEEIQSRRPLRNVLLPSYCCHTMIEPFLAHGVAVQFYEVTLDEHNRLIQDIPTEHSCDAILCMDYFGYIDHNRKNIHQNCVVIYDATHAVFSHATVKADYVYGSLRKWAGFWTGGFAWSCTEPFQIEPPTECEAQYISTRKLAMREKQRYLNGESSDGKEAYLRLFSQAEEQLDVRGTLCADPEDVKRIPFLDVERIRLRRRQNAETLLSMLEQYAIFPHLHPQDCPLFVPIVLPKTLRTTVRQHLIQHSIYCPIHWPVSNLHKLTERSRQIYDGELSLVCDQRYDRSDMTRMGQLITEFLRLERK